MMAYRLNMARGFVMPLDARNKWLRWFFMYLVVCSVLIAWVLFEVIQKVSHWHSRRDVVARQEALFLAGHPGVKSHLQ